LASFWQAQKVAGPIPHILIPYGLLNSELTNGATGLAVVLTWKRVLWAGPLTNRSTGFVERWVCYSSVKNGFDSAILMKKEEKSWVVDRRLNVVPSAKHAPCPVTTPQQGSQQFLQLRCSASPRDRQRYYSGAAQLQFPY